MIGRAASAGLLALAALALAASSAGAASAQAVARPPALVPGAAVTGPVTLALTSVSPAGLDADHALVVSGILRNPGPAITGATLRLRINRTSSIPGLWSTRG